MSTQNNFFPNCTQFDHASLKRFASPGVDKGVLHRSCTGYDSRKSYEWRLMASIEGFFFFFHIPLSYAACVWGLYYVVLCFWVWYLVVPYGALLPLDGGAVVPPFPSNAPHVTPTIPPTTHDERYDGYSFEILLAFPLPSIRTTKHYYWDRG